MLFLIWGLLLLCVRLTSSSRGKVENIIGGTQKCGGYLDYKDSAYIVLISRGKLQELHCGGTMVNQHFVLSAAHCTSKTKLYVYAGHLRDPLTAESHLYNSSRVIKQIQHPKYDRRTLLFDLALFQLEVSFNELSMALEFVHLPDWPIKKKKIHEWHPCTDLAYIAGWGTTTMNRRQRPKGIRCINTTTISPTECRVWYPHLDSRYHICMAAADDAGGACEGDDGGPMMCHGYQIGVISWGGCSGGRLCTVVGPPGKKRPKCLFGAKQPGIWKPQCRQKLYCSGTRYRPGSGCPGCKPGLWVPPPDIPNVAIQPSPRSTWWWLGIPEEAEIEFTDADELKKENTSGIAKRKGGNHGGSIGKFKLGPVVGTRVDYSLGFIWETVGNIEARMCGGCRFNRCNILMVLITVFILLVTL